MLKILLLFYISEMSLPGNITQLRGKRIRIDHHTFLRFSL